MVDWIDTLGDAIFQIAQSFMDSNRPKRLVGIAFAAITAFGAIGTLAAVALGANLGPTGFLVLIPALLTTSSIAGYCLSTNRDPTDSSSNWPLR